MKSNAHPYPVMKTGHGESIVLGHELGRGGEGTVYSVSGKAALAAKIYHGAIGREKADKISAMLAIKNDNLLRLTAWPMDLLVQDHGVSCGFTMSKIDDGKDIHILYSPKSRKLEFPKADWRFLIRTAANVARAFAIIHEAGCVIGDVNHGSVNVSPQAIVKLIDCDSFQVMANGQLFSCDVGNPTFTPPELQGMSLAGLTRTPNHDAFGLAVLIFHLLFMGRHPFAGRYSGSEDMPIEKAIKEFRFAYGGDQSATGMQPPPYTLPLATTSASVAELFVRAFGRDGIVNGGRPTPKQWIIALEGLEKNLQRCPRTSSHYFHNSLSSCPWCPIEAATGVALFSTDFQIETQSSIDMASLWTKIISIKPSSQPPQLMERSDFGIIEASPEAIAVGQKNKVYNSSIACMVIASVLIALSVAPNQLLFIILAGIGLYKVLCRKIDVKAISHSQSVYNDAKSRLEYLHQQWKQNLSDLGFKQKFDALASMRQQWGELPNLRLRKLKELESTRREQQLQRFLERFYIEKADIPSIGPGRKTMLQSYNIETAWDVTSQNVMRVPGFGVAMTNKLIGWRKSIEKNFVFSATQGVDPREIKKVEQEIIMTRRNLEQKLVVETDELSRHVQQIEMQRHILKNDIDKAFMAFLQAEMNLQAIK